MVAVLFAVPTFLAQPPQGDELKVDKPFDDVTLVQIKESLDKANIGKPFKIDGSDNNDNHIPKGRILCYITNDNRYGKLKVVEYGYNLTVKWVTYDEDGGVFSKGGQLVVRGTWGCDLDYGVEGSKGKSKIDFWWQQVEKPVLYFVFLNGAVFTIYPNNN